MLRLTNRKKHVIKGNYEMNSTTLTEADTVKYLGLTISKDLSWKPHVNQICAAAEKKLWFLRRKLKLATPSVKLLAYLTYVRSTLEYASAVWDPFQSGLTNRIEKIQRNAARLILSRYSRNDSVSEMLRLLDLPTLAERRKLTRLKFLFLLSKRHFNIETRPYLIPRQTRNVRSSNQFLFSVPKCCLDVYAYSFFSPNDKRVTTTVLIKEWNDLPVSVLTSTSIGSFEERIKNVL